MRAWVDESGSDRSRDPGTYVLAAAIGRRVAESAAREQIEPLLLPGQVKVHWRDESVKRRDMICRAVVGCELRFLAVVRVGADAAGERPERSRRKCLERLLHELEAQAVEDVVLESRGRADDRRDIEMVNALRGQRRLASGIRLAHEVGRREPMLWIADAVCGAVTSARSGTGRYLEILGGRVTVIEIHA